MRALNLILYTCEPNLIQVYMKGGAFLYEKTLAKDVFVPEEFNEEQLMIKDMINDFINQEVFPDLEKLDSMTDKSLMPLLLKKSGELGMLGVNISNFGDFIRNELEKVVDWFNANDLLLNFTKTDYLNFGLVITRFTSKVKLIRQNYTKSLQLFYLRMNLISLVILTT